MVRRALRVLCVLCVLCVRCVGAAAQSDNAAVVADARKLIDSGQPTAAIEKLRALDDRSDPHIAELLGAAYYHANDAGNAIATLTPIVDRLEAGKAREALVAFEKTMKKEPNRFRGVYGGARAAEALGERAKAATYYRKLLEIAKDADTERTELQHAKRYVGGRS